MIKYALHFQKGESQYLKTSSKAQEKCQVKLEVTLDADEMKAIVKDVEKTFLREAQLPGLRGSFCGQTA